MFTTMEALREHCLSCQDCPLAETRTKVAFGVGPHSAQVLFVGEGPGENEDLTGEPFVGRGGKLLDKYLETVGLSREKNVYIANIVKCRPPGNRDPLPAEQEACIGYLRNQVALLRPKIIVCLGRIAAQVIIKKDFKVTKEHGDWTERKGTWLMGTFHPAALLRNPGSKPAALEDFQGLREKIAKVCSPELYTECIAGIPGERRENPSE